MYKFLSGAKAVKQYRGDENLPEAKNGMKNCGCKHPKTKYKLGTKGLTDPPPSKVYNYWYEDPESGQFQIDPNKYKQSFGGQLKAKKNNPNLAGKIDVPSYSPSHSGGNLSWAKNLRRADAQENLIENTSLLADLGNPIHLLYHKDGTPNFIYKRGEESNQEAIDRGLVETFGLSTPKSRERGTAIFDEEKEKKIIEDYIKRNKYKREDLGYKYGTGALTIPEGSAIVTANGGKNKQAIAAYKKGNYKLLNKIIEEMPEDRVSKKQEGAYDLYSDERIAEKFGQKYDVDKLKYRSSLSDGKLNLKEDSENVKYRNQLRNDPAYFEKELKAGNVQIDDKGNITYTARGAFKKGKKEFLGTSKPKEGEKPTGGGIPEKGDIPTLIPPPEETPKKKKGFGEVPSLAEVAAKSSILAQGVENVPENYLKLGRYEYASQLPKTLREIQLGEQAGRENARDIVGGDAGRYLAQAGALSSARMKAANEAVIQDTLARQDVLNKNVDLGNVEAQTNTALKNQFAMQRSANRGAYNNMLVSLGQSIDTAVDTSKLMAAQKEADEQRIQVLKDAAKSGNYQWKQEGKTFSLVPKKKGAKRLKTYKRK